MPIPLPSPCCFSTLNQIFVCKLLQASASLLLVSRQSSMHSKILYIPWMGSRNAFSMRASEFWQNLSPIRAPIVHGRKEHPRLWKVGFQETSGVPVGGEMGQRWLVNFNFHSRKPIQVPPNHNGPNQDEVKALIFFFCLTSKQAALLVQARGPSNPAASKRD